MSLTSSAPFTLQELIWPERGICTERDLYVRLDRPAGLDSEAGPVCFQPGGRAAFDTYFNLFPLGKWVKHCDLQDISLGLSGQGRFEVTVRMAIPDRSWEVLHVAVHDLSTGTPACIDLSHFAEHGDRGALMFEVVALSEGQLDGAVWQTNQAPLRRPDLALSITTFKREEAVRATVARFEGFVANSALKDHLQMIVVDNGQSAGVVASDFVTPVNNENLGGAGGFSRGLLEAKARGASHCLFMDDDATVHMEAVERTWTFLAYARNPASAVAGAMANGSHRWSIWENGALFDGSCKPLHMGTDLRAVPQVMEMEFDSTRQNSPNLYGGWWYFAFPVNEVQHMPFPFFVRGDDVSFSLVHDFNIVTLPGVLSFQDSFTDKESPLTWYLDLRSHMAHHLSLPGMDNGWKGTLKIPVLFFLRNVLRHHFNTQAANALAFEDVLRGPDFFAENADMAERRGRLKEITSDATWGDETWKEIRGDQPVSKIRFDPHNRGIRLLMKLTLNGYLIPFFGLFGNRMVLEAQDRGNVRLWWGAAEIICLDAKREKYYSVRHSKLRFAKALLTLVKNSLSFVSGYDGLKAKWQKGYETLTTEGFWKDILKVSSKD